MNKEVGNDNGKKLNQAQRLAALLDELAIEADNLLIEGQDLKFKMLKTIDKQKKNKILSFIQKLPHS